MTRSRQKKYGEKGRNTENDYRENYVFSDSDDAEWLHDGNEHVISTSESESLVEEEDTGDVIMDDNDGLNELGEECNDASTATDDEGSFSKKR